MKPTQQNIKTIHDYYKGRVPYDILSTAMLVSDNISQIENMCAKYIIGMGKCNIIKAEYGPNVCIDEKIREHCKDYNQLGESYLCMKGVIKP